MPGSSGPNPVGFEVKPEGFRELYVRTAAFDEKLDSALRTNIRGAALVTVTEIRTRLLSGSFSTSAGMRQGIADGLKVQPLRTSKGRSGVIIVATAASMLAGKALMVKAWQKDSFKHEVFGNRAVLVTQPGRPYFEDTVTADRTKFTNAATKAMKQAADTLSRS